MGLVALNVKAPLRRRATGWCTLIPQAGASRNMTSPCIHGFAPVHCASCRPCRHGRAISSCRRCAVKGSSRSSAKVVAAAQPSVEHLGFEIFFAPTQHSWYYRAHEGDPLPRQSYGSVFQARKAIDMALDSAPAAAPKKRKKAN